MSEQPLSIRVLIPQPFGGFFAEQERVKASCRAIGVPPEDFDRHHMICYVLAQQQPRLTNLTVCQAGLELAYNTASRTGTVVPSKPEEWAEELWAIAAGYVGVIPSSQWSVHRRAAGVSYWEQEAQRLWESERPIY